MPLLRSETQMILERALPILILQEAGVCDRIKQAVTIFSAAMECALLKRKLAAFISGALHMSFISICLLRIPNFSEMSI